ncbi:MAG TPA: hypothetical protein GX707_21120 [Epulopiscium sp.]|nr:hypothetical protein [Candidatus Epulonipiscium sp.]
MQIGEISRTQDIYFRIFQLERRITMDWYNKDQLLDDLYNLRAIIHILAKKHEEIENQLNTYYTRIDLLVDQLI